VDAAGVASYALWWVAAAAVLVASGVLAARAAGAPSEPTTSRTTRPDDAARDLVVSTDRAATRLPYGADERRAWKALVSREGNSIDAAARTQAERLGPFAYVSWAAYGGHIDARTLDELLRRG